MELNPTTAAGQDIPGLESVISTAELSRRPSRAPDYEAENRALIALAQEMVGSPDGILQKLAETAMALCRAHSAGISLLDEDRKRFCWRAIVGRWAPYLGGGTPRDFSPCGTVLDRNSALLFSRPERHFTYLASVTPCIEEGLLVPFHVEGEAVGTIWVIAHDERCRFDAEDLRIMTDLSHFAATAYQTLLRVNALAKTSVQLQRAATALRASNDRLTSELSGMTRLQEVSAQLVMTSDIASLLLEVVDAAIALTDADMGNIQLLDRDGALKIVASRGFGTPFLEFFSTVHTGEAACGVAMERNEQVIIEDVALSPVFRDTSALDVMLAAGARSVQSTPLVTRSGRLLGVFSTHYRAPRRPADWELRLLHLLARQATDALERTEAEAALRESEKRLTLALAAGGMGVYDWNLVDDQLWWSSELYHIFGVTPDQFTPTPAAFTTLVHSDDRELFWRRLEEGIAQRHPFEHEFRIVRPDGALRWVGVRAKTEYDATGRAVRCFGVAVDITERKQAEEALRASDRAKDHFLSMIGHELHAPLGMIASAASILNRVGSSELIAERARATIDRETKNLSRLVDDLLDVSRVTIGKVKLVRQPLELGELVTTMVDTWRASGRFRRHEVTVDVSSVWVESDPVRIEQVLSNLVGNALKYTSVGGHVSVRVGAEENVAVLEVSDTGVGIPADLLEKVFDLFVQGERALDRTQGGLGIGLTMVRMLVEMHQGTVVARSEGLGKGAVFTVRLPRLPVEARSGPTLWPPAMAPAPWRILVVEDEEDAREMLRVQLALQGHEVHVAADGSTGIDAARAVAPDVALVDLGLPDLDGYEVGRRIRADRAGESVLLIALTDQSQAEERRRALEAGFDAHVTKPVSAEGLAAVIVDAATARRLL